MERKAAIGKVGPWAEPAHPAVVQHYDDLVRIYAAIREKVQHKINAAFDDISRTIGFVVTTTVPVALMATKKGVIERMEIDASHMKDTLFERGIGKALEPILNSPIAGISEGTYKILILWQDALKLKLRRDWVEPAHVVTGTMKRARLERLIQIRPEIQEPAHWFDPGLAIEVEEMVLISAIDQVYPELRLAERITATRVDARQFVPEVQEPAHFRPGDLFTNEAFVAELQQLVRRFTQ